MRYGLPAIVDVHLFIPQSNNKSKYTSYKMPMLNYQKADYAVIMRCERQLD